MQRSALPDIFKELKFINCELDYSVFDGASDQRLHHLMAIDSHLTDNNEPKTWHLPPRNSDALQAITGRKLTREEFLGDWCDPFDLMLIYKGSGNVAGLGEVQDVRYDKLGSKKVGSWGSGVPNMSEAGQYAYAFSQPPYGLNGERQKIAHLFRVSTQCLLPPNQVAVIIDWSLGDLGKVSPYFEAGLEWWGTFLFTIFQPVNRLIYVVSGSTTD